MESSCLLGKQGSAGPTGSSLCGDIQHPIPWGKGWGEGRKTSATGSSLGQQAGRRGTVECKGPEAGVGLTGLELHVGASHIRRGGDRRGKDTLAFLKPVGPGKVSYTKDWSY